MQTSIDIEFAIALVFSPTGPSILGFVTCAMFEVRVHTFNDMPAHTRPPARPPAELYFSLNMINAFACHFLL